MKGGPACSSRKRAGPDRQGVGLDLDRLGCCIAGPDRGNKDHGSGYISAPLRNGRCGERSHSYFSKALGRTCALRIVPTGRRKTSDASRGPLESTGLSRHKCMLVFRLGILRGGFYGAVQNRP